MMTIKDKEIIRTSQIQIYSAQIVPQREIEYLGFSTSRINTNKSTLNGSARHYLEAVDVSVF